MAYPMKGMLLFMDMEDMVGKDLSEGLSNLKSLLESMPPPQAAEGDSASVKMLWISKE